MAAPAFVTSTTVPPGTVVDTTTSPQWTPVRVVARLTEPVVGLDTNPLHLDGLLSWAGYLTHVDQHGHLHLPPLSPDQCADFALPLATWAMPASVPDPHPLAVGAGGLVWGWACSAAWYTPAGHTTVNVRRRPATDVMARYTTDNSHHLSTGPLKARDTPHPATLVGEVTWWALADRARLQAMLDRVIGVGRMPRHGHGRVLRWTVGRDDTAIDQWRWRHLPDPAGRPETIRAPYHHHSRRMPCAPLGAPPWA